MISLLIFLLLIMVLIGTLPILVLVSQFFIAGLHGIYNHYAKCKPYLPRIAILIPAWNEADVLEGTLQRLTQLDYPTDSLRIVIIDDASTDNTQEIVASLAEKYPGRILSIRRDQGGLGKCHTLNAGLKAVLADSWAEAIMITDADIVFENGTLQKMSRHLADPEVGAVTCYIKVELKRANFLNDCIASEYILSQAIARRAQNVTHALACMAGGAQLHSRKNIELLGGQINTTTLAEDTYTTFMTQINHHRALFEGNGIVKAEEPNDLLGFWKQRFRWSRGNIQITKKFHYLWFRRGHSSKLGGIYFGLTWFSTMMMPFTMIMTSVSLIALLFIDPERSWTLFRMFYIVSSISYITSTLLSFAIDPVTMKKCWFSTIMFPGLISIILMFISITNILNLDKLDYMTIHTFTYKDELLLLMNFWVAGCMFFIWLIYRLALIGAPKLLINTLIAVVGYGPLLCTITFLAFIAEHRKSSLHWNKTEKVLKQKMPQLSANAEWNYERELQKNIKAERRFLRDEMLIITFIIILFWTI